MSTVKVSYPAGTVTATMAPENVATSSTFVAGVESASVTNVSNLDIDHLWSFLWTSGTTPTANTQVQYWVVPALTDDLGGTITWPDVFDGTSSAETVTSAGVLQGCGRLLGIINVDSNTTARNYWLDGLSVAACFGGNLPTTYVIFCTHNTGVNSNTTAGNFKAYYQRVQYTVA